MTIFRAVLWVFLLAASSAALGRADEARERPGIPTGIEWLQAGGSERQEALLAALMTVQSSGIKMEGSFLEYDDGLRRHLLRRPELQRKILTDILADYLYETDPSSRALLDSRRAAGA